MTVDGALDYIERNADAVRYADPPFVASAEALAAEVRLLRDLLSCFADDDPCWFDHHGGCQGHGFLSLDPGELCPVAQARLAVGLEPLSR